MVESHFNKYKEYKLKALLALETKELLQPQGEILQLVNQAGQISDEEQLAFIADPGIEEAQVSQQTIPQNLVFQTKDLDAYDSNCDDISSAKAVLMENLSSYDLDVLFEVVQIVLWYLDSRCSKHMIGNRSQLINFVSKFLGTIRFRNDHIAKIMGYGDYKMGNVTISRVYFVEGLGHNLFSVGQFCTVRFRNDHIAKIMGYGDYKMGNVTISRVCFVEGLGHNLFSMGQFCDSDLEVAFRKHTCFIRDLKGVDLLKGSRGSNLYTLSLDNLLLSSLICLLSKVS
ncbi:hypothetical protein Tco_1021483, partial [Tanacetum coccineum]